MGEITKYAVFIILLCRVCGFFFSLSMALNTEIIRAQFNEMGALIERKDFRNTDVSRASVGWHLSHLLKVFHAVYRSMKASNPAEFKKEFSLARTTVFFTGKIPRGKARAPKATVPDENLEKRALELQLHEAKQHLYAFENLPKNAHFPHPFFKQLNKKQTLKFLKIHNEHHLKIVRDILK